MMKRLLDLNLKEICFTDHVDYDIKNIDYFIVDYEKYFENLNSIYFFENLNSTQRWNLLLQVSSY